MSSTNNYSLPPNDSWSVKFTATAYSGKRLAVIQCTCSFRVYDPTWDMYICCIYQVSQTASCFDHNVSVSSIHNPDFQSSCDLLWSLVPLLQNVGTRAIDVKRHKCDGVQVLWTSELDGFGQLHARAAISPDVRSLVGLTTEGSLVPKPFWTHW